MHTKYPQVMHDRAKELRRQGDLSIRGIGHYLGVSHDTIRQWTDLAAADYTKKYCEENAERRCEYTSEYTHNHREERQAYYREYRAKYYSEHREKCLAANKKYREENKEALLRQSRDYYKTPSGKEAQRNARHRRRERLEHGNGIDNEQITEMLEAQEGKCFYCKEKMLLGGNCYHPLHLTIDHVVPLSKGGIHDVSNIVLACRGCNSEKHDKVLVNGVLE